MTYTCPRAERQARWRRAKVAKLEKQINAIVGDRCAECGGDVELEYDHPYGRNWIVERLSRPQRLKVYLREAVAGLLRRLCRSCNGRDGACRKRALARAMAAGHVFEYVGAWERLDALLDHCQTMGWPPPRIELGPDGLYRGSVLVPPGTVAPF